ncbi:MAG: hypothetical protein AVDCRST_MAG20-259, partial [uncultured Acidimicrobiales bacterium]
AAAPHPHAGGRGGHRPRRPLPGRHVRPGVACVHHRPGGGLRRDRGARRGAVRRRPLAGAALTARPRHRAAGAAGRRRHRGDGWQPTGGPHHRGLGQRELPAGERRAGGEHHAGGVGDELLAEPGGGRPVPAGGGHARRRPRLEPVPRAADRGHRRGGRAARSGLAGGTVLGERGVAGRQPRSGGARGGDRADHRVRTPRRPRRPGRSCAGRDRHRV